MASSQPNQTKPALFTRNATGLTKDYGLWVGTILTIGNVNLGLDIAQLYYATPATIQGTDVGLLLTISFLPTALWGIIYWVGAIVMPRSGGDYVWMGRALRGMGGFAYGFFFLFLSFINLGYNADLFSSFTLSQAFAAQGAITNNSALVSIGSYFATPQGILVAGILLLVGSALIAMFGYKTFAFVQTILIVIGYLSMLAVLLVVASTSHTQFVNTFNQEVAGTTSYSSIISTASSNNVFLGFSFGATISSLPFAALIYGGLTSNVYVAGETKRVSRNIPLAIFIALIIAWAFMTGLWLLILRTFGRAFVTATGALAFSYPKLYPLPVPPTINYFVGLITHSPALTAFIGIGFIAWAILIEPILFLVVSRIFFAMSFDRLLPSRFADVSDKFHTPVFATVVTLVFSIIVTALLTLTNVAGVTDAAGMADGLAPCIVAFGIAALPFTNKGVFASGPQWVRRKVAGIPWVTLVGIVFGAWMIIATYYSIVTSPLIISNIVFFAALVLGVLLYPAISSYRKRQGIDLSAVFKEIPPE